MKRKQEKLLQRLRLSALLVTTLMLGVCPLWAKFSAEEGLSAAQEEIITLSVGRSHLLDPPWKVKRASVTNPEIADVQALTPDRILLMGKSVGSTDVYLWSDNDDVWQAAVNVVANLDQLRATLQKTFPGSRLELKQSQNVIIVSGVLARAEHVKQLRALLDAIGFKYVDTTRLAGVQQVQVQVRIAEVSRTAIKALTVNAFHVGEDAFGVLQIGPDSGGALNPVNLGVPVGAPAVPDIPFVFTDTVNVSPVVTAYGGFPDHNLQVFVQALAENQYLRILAEPTLVALSGEEASFLVGGEYPVPVIQAGSESGTSITIEYKEYGIRLRFRPEVLGEGTIRLDVSPEVSDLTDTGAVEIEGFRIPAIFVRRAATSLELKNGQTFAIAGLLNSTREARNSRIPFLGDLPILGSLFRSVRYTRGETELIVLAKVSLVEPLSIAGSPPVPGSVEIEPEDWEIFLQGETEGLIPSGISSPEGSYGLEKLKGPGAWAGHDKRSIPLRPRPVKKEETKTP